jgi:hypothetical protein
MPELLPSTYEDFLTRFGNLYDTLVRQVLYNYAAGERNGQVTVTLSVRDRERPPDNSWCMLTLLIDDVVEFHLLEGKSTNVVLSSGLSIGAFADSVYLDFSPYTEVPRSIADFQRSTFLVAGRRCVWSVSD